MSKRIRLYGLMTLAVAFAFSLAFVGNVNAADLTVGNLTVTNDAHFQWPIYADGNLIKFKNGNPNYGAMIDFGSGNSSIYDKGDLHVTTDDYLNFDFKDRANGTAYVNGKLIVNDNLVATYPIYAKGNEIIFNGNGVGTKDDGVTRIYKTSDNNLTISATLNMDGYHITNVGQIESNIFYAGVEFLAGKDESNYIALTEGGLSANDTLSLSSDNNIELNSDNGEGNVITYSDIIPNSDADISIGSEESQFENVYAEEFHGNIVGDEVDAGNVNADHLYVVGGTTSIVPMTGSAYDSGSALKPWSHVNTDILYVAGSWGSPSGTSITNTGIYSQGELWVSGNAVISGTTINNSGVSTNNVSAANELLVDGKSKLINGIYVGPANAYNGMTNPDGGVNFAGSTIVRIQNSAGAPFSCSVITLGAIYYDSTAKQFFGCQASTATPGTYSWAAMTATN